MRSHPPTSRPRASSDGKRPTPQTFASHGLETCATIFIESLNVVTSRTDTVRVRLPPLVKGRMSDVDRNSVFFHIAQAGSFEYLSEVPPVRPGEQRFILRIRVDRVHHIPERRQSTGRPVPHACRDDTTGACHARHLSDAEHWIRHEVHHQLR